MTVAVVTAATIIVMTSATACPWGATVMMTAVMTTASASAAATTSEAVAEPMRAAEAVREAKAVSLAMAMERKGCHVDRHDVLCSKVSFESLDYSSDVRLFSLWRGRWKWAERGDDLMQRKELFIHTTFRKSVSLYI